MSVDAIPTPSFLVRDPAVITAEIVAEYEALTGRTLQPAQVERVLIDLFAYRESLLRIAIQEAALQNLVAFARYPMLDYLGEIVGAVRLAALPAVTNLRFTLSGIQGVGVRVPAGTRVQAVDGRATFATAEELVIPGGSLTGDVLAAAVVAGTAANGYAAGTVKTILDPVPLVTSAANLGTTAGGAEVESDESYRERVRQAPEQFSVAGSVGAYRYHTLTVSSTIVDVAISSSAMGIVRVAVLTDTGLPSAELLEAVSAALSADRVRPLTDTVQTIAPTEVPYQIEATVRVLAGADPVAVLAAVTAAAEAYAAERRAGLGRDVVPSQIVAALSVPGVYQVVLTAPAAAVEVGVEGWANCTLITITEGAIANG